MRRSCCIYLLGGLKAVVGEREIDRFRTRKTATLLAYLMLAALARRRGDAAEAQVRIEEARRAWAELGPRWQGPFVRALKAWHRDLMADVLTEAGLPDGPKGEESPGGTENR
jgi:hypothetical protein